MSVNVSTPTILRVSSLDRAGGTDIAILPDRGTMDTMMADLGLSGLRKVSLRGTLAPRGKRDWSFKGTLGATVVQPCVVTLDPVSTRLDVAVSRAFVSELSIPAEEEVEMPEDDSEEPLGPEIDLGRVLEESLALNLPLYPRSEGAELGAAQFAQKGVKPMSDDDARPFAGLAGLRDKLDDGGEK